MMYSDGVSDVMDPMDIVFMNSPLTISSTTKKKNQNENDENDENNENEILLTAQDIIEISKSRWFGDMLLNKGDGNTTSFRYAPTPKFADDISCLIVHGY
jgi:hypothetical protein